MLGLRATVLVGIVSSFGAAGTLGCAARPGAAAVGNASKSEANRVELEHLVVTPTTADSIAKIHDRGMQHLQNREFLAAERDFDLCLRAAPGGQLAASALYHGGIALDELGRLDVALRYFTAVVERFPKSPHAQDAALRAVRLGSHLERWELARRMAEPLLAVRATLRPFDVVLIEGATALAAIHFGDDAAAETHIARARDAIENNGLDAPGKISRDIASVYFALGEVRRRRAERIRLVPPPPNFGQVLEQRCELILAAQAAYSDAMRAYDAHWSTMSGYRIGELYSALHQELMSIRAPEPAQNPGGTAAPGATAASDGAGASGAASEVENRRRLFEGAMRLRYSVLVEKALNMMTHTLTMAERTGERSEWVTRARQAQRELEQRLLDEEAALARLPYSRDALQEALRKLEQPAPKKN